MRPVRWARLEFLARLASREPLAASAMPARLAHGARLVRPGRRVSLDWRARLV